MPTIEEIKDYLGIDWDDDGTNRRLLNLLETAKLEMAGTLGKNYPVDDPRVHELILISIGQMYDNTDAIAKVSSALEKKVANLEWLIKLDMRVDADEV